jgi:uncharacterized membrane-anchored protein
MKKIIFATLLFVFLWVFLLASAVVNAEAIVSDLIAKLLPIVATIITAMYLSYLTIRFILWIIITIRRKD